MFFVFFKFTWICGVPRAAHLCKCERFFTFQGEFLVQDMKEKKKNRSTSQLKAMVYKENSSFSHNVKLIMEL